MSRVKMTSGYLQETSEFSCIWVIDVFFSLLFHETVELINDHVVVENKYYIQDIQIRSTSYISQ